MVSPVNPAVTLILLLGGPLKLISFNQLLHRTEIIQMKRHEGFLEGLLPLLFSQSPGAWDLPPLGR